MDLFRGLGDVTGRKMFGGLSLYHEGTIFGIVSSDGATYLKSTGALARALKEDGAEQFHSMPYWGLSDAALVDPGEAVALAHRSLSELTDPP